jgi:hypothetical protein
MDVVGLILMIAGIVALLLSLAIALFNSPSGPSGPSQDGSTRPPPPPPR